MDVRQEAHTPKLISFAGLPAATAGRAGKRGAGRQRAGGQPMGPVGVGVAATPQTPTAQVRAARLQLPCGLHCIRVARL